LKDKGSLSAYLGIQVEHLSGNQISMTQPALITRIIDQANLCDMRMQDTPADVVLSHDGQGEPRKTKFHYCSVIGQLNCLAATTPPDIQFSVHQCARFCEDPKLIHQRAVKCIIRYLHRTPDKGFIMHVKQEMGIQCFVDADFAGSYKKENPMNPRDCLSCTGYVVKFANCPIILISNYKQQLHYQLWKQSTWC
jgi:hypothetical protein